MIDLKVKYLNDYNPLTLYNIVKWRINLLINFKNPFGIEPPDTCYNEYIVHSFDDIRDDCFYIDCCSNNLSSLPNLNHFTNLKYLNCKRNKLTSLPNLNNFTKLEYLNCKNNKLTSLPNLNNLTKLEYINCFDNELTSLPNLNKLTKLKYLNCGANKITLLPDLNNLVKLTKLYCERNELTSLPNLYNLVNLEDLFIDHNNLTSFPISIYNCKKIKALFYGTNKFKNIPFLLFKFYVNMIGKVDISDEIFNQNDYFAIFNKNDYFYYSKFPEIKRLNIFLKIPFRMELIDEFKNGIINEKLYELIDNNYEYHGTCSINFSQILLLIWNFIKFCKNEDQIIIKQNLNKILLDMNKDNFYKNESILNNLVKSFYELVIIEENKLKKLEKSIIITKERLEGNNNYSIEEHKRELKKELLEIGYELKVINEWLEYIE